MLNFNDTFLVLGRGNICLFIIGFETEKKSFNLHNMKR